VSELPTRRTEETQITPLSRHATGGNYIGKSLLASVLRPIIVVVVVYYGCRRRLSCHCRLVFDRFLIGFCWILLAGRRFSIVFSCFGGRTQAGRRAIQILTDCSHRQVVFSQFDRSIDRQWWMLLSLWSRVVVVVFVVIVVVVV